MAGLHRVCVCVCVCVCAGMGLNCVCELKMCVHVCGLKSVCVGWNEQCVCVCVCDWTKQYAWIERCSCGWTEKCVSRVCTYGEDTPMYVD